MRSTHTIDLENSKTPSYEDDIDFFNMMFSKICGVLFNTSELSGWNYYNSSITNINKIKKIGDFDELYLKDDITNCIIEISYDKWEENYGIEITIPDKFNSKYIEIKNAPENVVHQFIKNQFPKIKLPKKAKNNVTRK